MKRRILALLLSAVMFVSMFAGLAVSAAGYTPKYTKEAEALYTLGLFQGMGKNADGTPKFALEQKATRIQGLVMLIRLLGKEEEALAYTGECPFTDVPQWAEQYAAYAYDNGITKGTSATTFSADAPLLGKAYVTFVLRALGYDDAAGDFTYNDALTKGQELGLVTAGACTGEIYRDDCVVISYQALKTKMKGSDTMLATKLQNEGVLTSGALEQSKLLFGEVKIPYRVEETPDSRTKYMFYFNGDDILAAIPNAAYFSSSGWGGHSKAEFDRMEFPLVGLWMGDFHLRMKLEGKDVGDVMSPKYAYGAPTNCVDGFRTITVMDKNFNLVAYGFLYPWIPAKDGELTFTTVFYNGEQDAKQLDSVLSKVKKFKSDAFYCEKIITKKADGTETVNCYLRVDEEKMPDEFKGFKYYSMEWQDDKDSLKRNYIGGRVISVLGQDTLEHYQNLGDGIRLYIYDDNKDIVASISLPRDLPVVETIIEE